MIHRVDSEGDSKKKKKTRIRFKVGDSTTIPLAIQTDSHRVILKSMQRVIQRGDSVYKNEKNKHEATNKILIR